MPDNMPCNTVEELTHLTCGMDGDLIGLPVSRIREILDTHPIRSLPHAPEFLLGYADLRGESVLVADLRLLLGRPFAEDTVDTRIVVLWVETPSGQRPVGLRTDCVYEVADLDGVQIDVLSDVGVPGWDSLMVLGVGRRNGKQVTLLNVNAMVSASVLSSKKQPVPARPTIDLDLVGAMA